MAEIKPDNLKHVIKRKFNGVVVSDKMDKTRVVSVESIKVHPIYKKRYKVNKKYKVHDEKKQYKVGDEVTFVGSKQFSKDKKWKVLY